MTIDPLFSNFTLKLELLGLLSKQVLCQGKEAWEPSMPSWVAMGWVLDEAGSRDMASISLREDVGSSKKKARKANSSVHHFQFSMWPRCLDICWMLFQWMLVFQTLAPVCSGLQTSTADFLFGFKSHVSKSLRWQAVRMQPRLWNITTCFKGSIVSLSSASQSFVVPLRFRHLPFDVMPAPRRILQHPVLSRVEEWNWTAMHEDHACMLYLNPFVRP